MKKINFNGVHFTVALSTADLQFITADAGFVCDKAAVNGDKIKGTL